MQNILNDIIQNRRSVYPKFYTGETVDDRIIESMLENANWAPTHRLTQPWRFVVFKGEGLTRLANFQAIRYKQSAGANFDSSKYQKLLSKPKLCSHIIAVGLHRDRRESIPEIEEVCSVACAVQNMLLTASASEIGAYWSTGGTTFDGEAKPFFGLESQDTLLGFIHVGMPDKSILYKSSRTPIAEKTVWEV